ncbi:acyltransferase [Nocardioides oceani]|uniref:acyltransferase n=1 Tax=Nocardioides oceani TaxID=3058369 RepID=UPI0034DEF2C6
MNSNLAGRSTLGGSVERLARAALRRMTIHENVLYGDSLRVGRGCVISAPHRLMIGRLVSIGPRTIIQVDGAIGDLALIGMGVQIVGRDDHAVNEVGVPYVLSTWVGDRDPTARDQVDIGRDVWIGGSSTVLSGISIGEGALVGSGSVVTRSIPPYAIAAGNPARVLSERFGEQDQKRHSAALDEFLAETHVPGG